MINEVAVVVGVKEGYANPRKTLQVALTQSERDKVLAFISALHGGRIKLFDQECAGFVLGTYSPNGWDNLRELFRQSNEQAASDEANSRSVCEAMGIPVEPEGEQA